MKHTAEGPEIFSFAVVWHDSHIDGHNCGGMALDLALFAPAALGFRNTSESHRYLGQKKDLIRQTYLISPLSADVHANSGVIEWI